MVYQKENNSAISTCSNYFSQRHCKFGELVEAKIAETQKNYGRMFFACPNYNKEGLPYYNFFECGDLNSKVTEVSNNLQVEAELKMSKVKEQIATAKYKCCLVGMLASWIIVVLLYTGSKCEM